MLRVVLDTVVFVRALINSRSYSGRLLSAYADRYTIVFSKETATELLEVIRRPELARRYKALNALQIESVIDLVAQATFVNLGEIPAVVRNVKDDIFVATARAAQADYLVTEDQDLLVLGNRLGFEIVNTRTWLERLEQLSE